MYTNATNKSIRIAYYEYGYPNKRFVDSDKFVDWNYVIYMFYFLKGIIATKDKNFVVLEVAGVGYEIYVGKTFLDKLKINEEVKIFVYLYLKQDSWDLYGFEKESELKYFKTLNNITRIGPKIALKILSLVKIENLERAVLDNDINFLTEISGIGKKNAQRIILELKEKIKGSPSLIDNKERKTIFEALKKLGYSQEQIRDVIGGIKQNLSLEEKIREAIKILSLPR